MKYFLLGALLAVVHISVYLSGWNQGYDVGVVSKRATDFLMNQDKVMCHYVGKKCDANKCEVK